VYDLLDMKENCPQMARLVGVDLPREKRLEVALTYVYGIGRTRALETLKATGVSGDTRVHALTGSKPPTR
jgi:small subunit ribosomal protein S13